MSPVRELSWKAENIGMNWKFFLGACILAAGLLLKAGAPLFPIALGVVAAGFVTWTRSRGQSTRQRPH